MSELHFTVHARLLTLHVRYICRTTQQLDCDLATFLRHPKTPSDLKSRKVESLTGAPTSRQPVMLLSTSTVQSKQLWAEVAFTRPRLLSKTGAPALLRCQWHVVSVLPALAPRLAPSASHPPLCLYFRRWCVRKVGKKQFRSSSHPYLRASASSACLWR